jgi:large subunit ribosomal protein L20
MTRVKSKSAINHRKTMKAARGFKNARSRRVGAAKEALLHAGQYAYEGRKNKKRVLRALWIVRMNAALRENGLSYSKFIGMAKKSKMEIDRKMLSEIASSDPDTFKKILHAVQ